ncbi:Peptidase S1 domain-containing protein [Trichostrongylus colubriformis]|uniref:Peptidase S1 domain-containing protein n=1 Tax=Trichostrongylus colubriformis TaxID=6319 RepID=A0AAN8ICE9_TRICO
MEEKRISLLFGLLLTLTFATSDGIYDFKNCGLPGLQFISKRNKRSILKDKELEKIEDGDSPNSTLLMDNNNDPMQHVVMGGEKASLGEIPWSVRLTVDDRKMYTCGGTLVTRRHVITAAHCFMTGEQVKCSTKDMLTYEYVTRKFKVVVGGICRSGALEKCRPEEVGTTIRIKRAYYTRFFEEGCLGTADIAILELATDAPTGIHHVCLPHLHNVDELDEMTAQLFTAGWGRDPLHGYIASGTPYLQKIALGVKMTEKECYESTAFPWADVFCTVEHAKKNVCGGDSGSGVTTSYEGKHYLIGVVSRGSNCVDLLQGHAPSGQAHCNIAFYTPDIDVMLGMEVADRKASWEEIKLKLTAG